MSKNTRHRINLIKNQETILAFQQMFARFRLGVHVYLGIFFLVAFGVLMYFMSKNSALNDLLNQKTILLTQLQPTQNDEARLLLLSKKLNNYKEFSKDDAQFIPYYNLLQQVLQNSSQSARLSQFKIDKEQNVQFAFRFTNVDELTQSLRFIETESFLNHFVALSMNSFADGGGSEEGRFELTFSGTFKPIDETQ